MLRKIRLYAAIVFFALVTLLFLDFTGTIHAWFGWMAKVQFIPAVLSLNVVAIVVLVALTLLFGRVYCSVICPLGVLQDVIAWFGKRKKRLPYAYSKALSWLRYGFLVIFIAAFIAGLAPIAALLDPYASFGRIANSFFQPVYEWGNNLLAYIAQRVDSYAFYSVDVWFKGLPAMVTAAVVLVLVFVLAWRNGRTYCNTVCPVGTVLGFLSKYSLFRMEIQEDKCIKCGLCARKCKASCIDAKNHSIDHSRCVACMDCIGSCSHHAISYTRRHKTVNKEDLQPKVADSGRRSFITATAVVAATGLIKAQEKKVDGGLAVIEDKKVPERATRITPPGSLSLSNFTRHCTACQLCVSACPNQVLRPSGNIMTLMQPEMSYERGYCRPECNRCSQVCPAGAIRPITKEEKSSVQIGHAVWVRKNCVVETDGVSCGNCAAIARREQYKWSRLTAKTLSRSKFRLSTRSVVLVAELVRIYVRRVRSVQSMLRDTKCTVLFNLKCLLRWKKI